jgi:hypothetical protein
MTECKPVTTPLPRDLNLSLIDSPDEVNPELQSEYRGIVGPLMYLYQWTRPDLGFAVTFLSRYLHKPGKKHLPAAKHVLRYLKGVALCTAMAELIALAKLAVKVKYMRTLLFDMQCRQEQETMINSTCL